MYIIGNKYMVVKEFGPWKLGDIVEVLGIGSKNIVCWGCDKKSSFFEKCSGPIQYSISSRKDYKGHFCSIASDLVGVLQISHYADHSASLGKTKRMIIMNED